MNDQIVTQNNAQNDSRIKLTILGGFLGSGKSTWLRHQLFSKSIVASKIIVNEVSPNAVDDVLLHSADELHVIAGGCACCSQSGQMVRLLHDICNEQTKQDSENGAPSKHIVFEMSGVANPANVMQILQDDPILSRHILLNEIIVIVDGLHGLDQLQSEALSRHQVEAADRLIITKTENCNLDELSVLLSTLRQINVAQNISAASLGVETKLPKMPDAQAITLENLDGSHLEELNSIELELTQYNSGDFDWASFTVWLSAMLHSHGNNLVRVKGVVTTPAGRLLLQSVRKIMQSPEILPPALKKATPAERTKDNVVVLIGRGFDESQILSSLNLFME